MNFLNPVVLLGLVAALIPLLLHLLNLRRLRQQEFSTLRFLKQLERSTIRRFRLQQLLLLAVRMLLIAAVVLAFARPVLPAKLPGLQQRAPVSVLLVLDNSASMALGERFAAARRAAVELLRSLYADDEVLLLPVVSDTVLPEWAANHGAVLEQLQRMQPTATTAPLSVVLRRAIGLLGQARHWHRQVYVVSDFHRTQLGAQLPAELRLDARTQLFFVPVGSAQQPAAGEVVLDSVALVSQLHAAGQPVVVHARLRNLGERDAAVVVSLFLGQERGGAAEPPAGGWEGADSAAERSIAAVRAAPHPRYRRGGCHRVRERALQRRHRTAAHRSSAHRRCGGTALPPKRRCRRCRCRARHCGSAYFRPGVSPLGASPARLWWLLQARH
jgi:hypothetical protein